MARETSLAGAWSLTGREPWEDGSALGPLPCRVPGTAAAALEQAGFLAPAADPVARLAREWVARRQWRYECVFTPPEEPYEGRSEKFYLRLRVAGRGSVEVNGERIGAFDGPWKAVVCDITRFAEAGPCRIAAHIEEPMPGEDGEPRAGILEASVRQVAFARVLFARGIGTASGIETEVRLEGTSSGRVTCHYRVLLGDALAASHDVTEKLIADHQTYRHTIAVPDMRPWRVNGQERAVYTVRLTVERGGTRCDVSEFSCAWKDIEFGPAPGGWSPLPYALREAGVPLFLRGVNADAPLSPEDLRGIAEAGANMVRFHGPLPPDEEALAECDRLGLLIWQEVPPDDGAAIDMARRLAGHPAAAIASCGHGLRGEDGLPAGPTHPLAIRLRDAMRPYCDLTFLPTSPSGPIGFPAERDFGRGLCHDVHGPLEIGERLYREMDVSDALLFSKVGFPAPQALARAENWRETFGDYYAAMAYLCGPFEEGERAAFLAIGRHLQAEALRYALFAARRREGISCCGTLVWRLNTAPGLPISHALCDDGGLERPALAAMAAAYRPYAASVRLEKSYFLRGEVLRAPVTIHVPPGGDGFYAVAAQICDVRGGVLADELWQVRAHAQVSYCGEIALAISADTPEVLLLRLFVRQEERELFSDVLLLPVPQEGRARLEPLRRLPGHLPVVSPEDGQAVLQNDATEAACGVTIHAGRRLLFFGTLMPWEKRPLPLPEGIFPESLRVQTLGAAEAATTRASGGARSALYGEYASPP